MDKSNKLDKLVSLTLKHNSKKRTFKGKMYEKILVLSLKSDKTNLKDKIKALDRLLEDKDSINVNLIKKIPLSILQDILRTYRNEVLEGKEADNLFGVMFRYVEVILENDKFAITNNEFVSLFSQISQDISMPEIHRIEIDGMFSKINQDLTDLNVDKFSEKVNQFQPMNDSEFKEFVETLYKIRNSQRILPEIYCDYILKQKFDSNSVLTNQFNKYQQIYFRAYEDKARHMLNKKGVYNYITAIRHDLGANGYQDPKTHVIFYDKKGVSRINKKNSHMLNTLFHEVQHAYQHEKLENHSVKNENEYYMLKEVVLRELSGRYYYQNYMDQHTELDANIMGIYEETKFFQRVGLSNESIGDYIPIDSLFGNSAVEGIRNKKVKNIVKTYREEIKILIDKSKNKALYQDPRSIKIQGKQLLDTRRECIDVIFQSALLELLKKDPQLFEKYPELLKEFNIDGTRRGNMDILKEYDSQMIYSENHPNEKGMKLLYSSILKNHSQLDDSTIMKDAEQLLTFEPSNPAISKYRDMIIQNQILPILKKWKQNGQKDNSLKINQLSDILNQFVTKNPDLDISRTICLHLGINENSIGNEIQTLQAIDEEITPAERKEGISIIGILKQKMKDFVQGINDEQDR